MTIASDTLNTHVLAKALGQKLIDLLPSHSDFYRLLDQYGRVIPATNARGIEWQVITSDYDGVQALPFNSTAPASDDMELAEAFLDWGNYLATVGITDIDKKRLDSGLNGERLTDFWKQTLARVALNYVRKIDLQMRGASFSNGIVGHLTAADDTASYAGLSRTTYPELAAYINNISATLTEAHLDATWTVLSETKGGRCNVIVGNQTTINKLKGFDEVSIVQDRASLMAQGFKGVFGRGSMYRRLVPEFTYRGAEVYSVAGWAANRLDFMDLGSEDGPALEIFGGSNIENGIVAVDLGRTGSKQEVMFTLNPQYHVKNPAKTCAAITGIA